MDAMSEAIEGAEVMLYGVSEPYKESANCRLEANYAHQQDLDMIPLMMQEGYKANGWLGLCVHTRTDVYAQPADPLCLLPPEF